MTFKDFDKQKESQKNSYLRNKSKVIARGRKSKRIGKIVLEFLKESKPCKDCR